MTMMQRKSAYSGGRFTLELDQKKPVGIIQSIDGGHFKADPVPSMTGDTQVVTRYAGKPKYEDITITCGMAMSTSFWDWVAASLSNKPQRRNGAVVGYDFNNKERMRRTFKRALIAEVGFPALDAASKSAAYLTVKISPEQLEYEDGDGSSLIVDQAKDESIKQKLWLQSNFRFELEKFKGDDSLRNAKIEAFTLKQNIIQNPVGPELEWRKEVGRLEVPMLQVSFPESQVKNWMTWYKSTVVQGAPDQTTGAITYYASDQSTELMRLELDKVGIASIDIDKYEGGKENIQRVKVSMWVESVKLSRGKGTT